jgi:hypothetical protein
MSDAILGSALSAAAVVIVALITFYANARQQLHAKWRDQKVSYYTAYFDALSRYVAAPITKESERALAREANNIHLIASAEVLEAAHKYTKHCMDPKVDDPERHNALLADLLNAVRGDLDIKGNSPLKGSHVQLLSFSRR